MPNAGPPVRMSTAVKNDPKRHGAPGRTAWTRATPERASATCWASPAAMLTGAVAPASRNGVTITGWPATAHSMSASAMRPSHTSGLLGLTTPMITGASSIASRPPNAIAARSTASRAFGPDVP